MCSSSGDGGQERRVGDAGLGASSNSPSSEVTLVWLGPLSPERCGNKGFLVGAAVWV